VAGPEASDPGAEPGILRAGDGHRQPLALFLDGAARLSGYRREFATGDPHRAFAFFTSVAAPGMLAARLAGDGHTVAAAVLLVIGSITWLLLRYGVPPVLASPSGSPPALAGANGTWFVWVVGGQSIAVAATSLPPPVPGALTALAVGCRVPAWCSA
jgi:hypothetical protein